jgi:hypothetical protein
MTFLIVAVLYPLLFALLALGAGLLVDRASGGTIPGLLLVPFGVALIVVVGELMSYAELTARLIPLAAALLAVGGLVAGRERLRPRHVDRWALAAAVATYVIVCAPVLFAGRPTMPGYLLDTTVGIHLAGAEFLSEHARHFSDLAHSSLRGHLESYIGFRYPTGSYVLLLAGGRLTGQDLIWVYHPHIAMLLATASLVLSFLARSAGLRPGLAAVAGVLGAVPALVYAYALQGSIKEITLLPILLLLGAVIVLFPRLVEAGWRGAIPLTVVAAAGIAAIGVSFAPWFGLTALVCLVIAVPAVRSGRLRRAILIRTVAAFVLVLAVLALPTLLSLSSSVEITSNLSASNAVAAADPGNLIQPLKVVQMFGVWLNGSHRTDPSAKWTTENGVLIGVVVVAVLFGVAFVVRRRAWALLSFAGLSALVWLVLTAYGKTWADAKLLVLISPVAVLLAVLGAASLLELGRRAEGAALLAILAGAILLSNAFQYHDTNLLPTDRYEELLHIGERYAGTGPTLTPDFDEYALYALREMTPDGPGFAYKNERLLVLRDGTFPALGYSYDLDRLPEWAVPEYPMIVARRTPEQSSPPTGYRHVYAGRWYDVFKRERDRPQVVEHAPASNTLSAGGFVGCKDIRRLAGVARKHHGELRAQPRQIEAIVDPRSSEHTFPDSPEGVLLTGSGHLRGSFEVSRSGTYRLWLKGYFTREVDISVDSRPIGSVSNQSGSLGYYSAPLETRLEAGRHSFLLERGGTGLGPADNGAAQLYAVVIDRPSQPAAVTLAPDRFKSLCTRQVDWVEVLS